MQLIWHEHYKQFIPTFDLTKIEEIRECVAYCAATRNGFYGNEFWGCGGFQIANQLLAHIDGLNAVITCEHLFGLHTHGPDGQPIGVCTKCGAKA